MAEHCPFSKRLEALISRPVAREYKAAGRDMTLPIVKANMASERRNRLEAVADRLMRLFSLEEPQ